MSDTCLTSACSNYLSGPIGQLFSSSLQLLFAAQCLIDEQWPPDYTNNLSDLNFDYIVVGGGSAGCVVATRLSEDMCRRVLLVEAGGDPPLETMVPAGFVYLMTTNTYNWNYSTQGEPSACQATNGSCIITSGKVLGGGSSINGMNYVRGNRQDYDDIAAAGNEGWDYETALKYFKKSENMTDELIRETPKSANFHNFDGPLGVSINRKITRIHEAIVKAYEEAGYPYNPDYNGKNQMGVAFVQTTIADGKRSSTAKAYLSPAHDRPNLVLLKNALVTKIMISDKVANGVRILLSNGIKIEARASKEVIVSAGAIRTPQLLMLSGIGPKEHLAEFNISVIADLAVGQNMVDHVSLFIPADIRGPVPYHLDSEYPLDVAKYLAFRQGFFVDNYSAFISTQAFIPTDNCSAPSFQINHLIPADSLMASVLQQQQTTTKHAGIDDGTILETSMLFFITLLEPYSRGEITLASTAPTDYPRIRGNYLKDLRDVEKFLAGIKILKTLLKTSSFQSFNPVLINQSIPPCDSFEFDSELYWKCFLAQNSMSSYHVRGTAKMGPATDRLAVVNPHLQVYGLKQLRVVDGSIIPGTIRGNTNVPIMMIAERAADLIKEAHADDACVQ